TPCSVISRLSLCLFFFTVPAHSLSSVLPLHDALPIWRIVCDFLLAFFGRHLLGAAASLLDGSSDAYPEVADEPSSSDAAAPSRRSEEHTSELQSLTNLGCRLLLEKKKKKSDTVYSHQS